MSDTDKNEPTEQQDEAHAGFGSTIIHDHLVQVIRHPDNIRKDEERKKAEAEAAAENPPPDAA